MGTLVSPMRGAAVAIPAASRLTDLTALAVLLARLNIVNDGDDNYVGRFERRRWGEGALKEMVVVEDEERNGTQGMTS